jgi:hypothetical protein
MTPEEQIAERLRAIYPSVGARELEIDLWPRLAARVSQPAVRWTAWDWLVSAACVLCAAAAPRGLACLIYSL